MPIWPCFVDAYVGAPGHRAVRRERQGGQDVPADAHAASLGAAEALWRPLGVLEVEVAQWDLGDEHAQEPPEGGEVLLGADGVEGDDGVGVRRDSHTGSQRLAAFDVVGQRELLEPLPAVHAVAPGQRELLGRP